MKIGIMARAMDAIDGPGVGTRNLLDNLLKLDQKNEYVIFYRTDKYFGRYKKYQNVKERLIRAPYTLLWDQIVVPYIAWREGVDAIYHPKFTIPLLTRRPTAMTLLGSEWYIHPAFYSLIDILYIKLAMPIYCRKSTKLICISNVVKEDIHKHVGVHKDKMTTIYNAANEMFQVIKDEMYLSKIREKYNLPERFILTVSRGYHFDFKTSKKYPGKNLDKIVDSFLQCRDELSCYLVIAGKNIKEYLEFSKGQNFGMKDKMIFTGYIPQEDLPAIYNLAAVFLFPSFYESFSLPLVEAMGCGCPIVTSKYGASPEVAGDAAILVDPANTDEITTALIQVLSNESYRKELSRKSLIRGKNFSWEKAARETLQVIESLYM